MSTAKDGLADARPVEEAGGREEADPHHGLRPFMAAARLARAHIAVLPLVMHWEPRRPWPRAAELVAKSLVFTGAHLRLARALWRHRDRDLVVVREFLTQLVVIVWPLIWPLRRRVYFLVNHNLQEAHRRAFERALLRLLHRTGCRFACLETTEGFAELGILPDEERFLVLPHPLEPLAPPRPAGVAGALPVVGVVGEIRPEKGSVEILSMLKRLRDEGRLQARLMVGCNDATLRDSYATQGFEVADTSTRERYLEALDRCDVIVLNYRRDRYFYRSSGVAAEAMARRAVTVCPDYPIMRRMLREPVPVGAVFRGIHSLETALAEALALRPGLDAALAEHERVRSAAAIAARLDAFVARVFGRSP